MNNEISKSPPNEQEPTEPVVKCLKCGADFVWWLHPIQVADEFLTSEFEKCKF